MQAMTSSAEPPLVAHVIHRLDVGGLENGIVNLVNRMPRERYRHAIICLAGVNHDFQRRIHREDVSVLSLAKKPGKDVPVYGRMWRTLRRLRPAIVHTRNLGTVDMQWVALAAGVRHRVHGEHGWEAGDPRGQSPHQLRIRLACRPVIQRYVPMSRDIAHWLQQDVGVDASRIRQLYSGVDTERFCPPALAGERRGEGLTPSPASAGEGEGALVTIGTVGRLDPVKNQAALLEAVASLLPSFSRLRLLIVGDGPVRGQLEAQALSLGLGQVVTFTGARADTPELLRSLDLFVLPSVNEGISNTILEAMATGLPVVAGRVGGNPELVAEGVTGALYDPSQPDGLRQAIVRYLMDPALRRAHGWAGRERVVQNFSLDAMVQRYLSVYDELLSSPSPRHGGRRVGVRGS
jgi:sugar transferase (PEP-CTERM/EpsH1 system associated)